MVSRTHDITLVVMCFVYVTTSVLLGVVIYHHVMRPLLFLSKQSMSKYHHIPRQYKKVERETWQQIEKQTQHGVRSVLLAIPRHHVELKRLILSAEKGQLAWRPLTVKVTLAGSFAGLMAWLSAWINLHKVFRFDSFSMVMSTTHQLKMQLVATYWIAKGVRS